MLPKSITLGPLAAASANFYVTSVTPTSGTALTLANSTPATPRRVLLTYGVEGSARTLRITGTNADNNPIRETLAVPSGGGGTVATVQDFASITEAMPLGGGWTAAATLGTNGTASSPWQLTNAPHQAAMKITWDGQVSGTVTWGIQWTMSQINDNANQIGSAFGNYPSTPVARDISVLTAQTTDAQGSLDNPFTAWRVVVTAGTGSVTVLALEGGMTGVKF